MSDIDDVISKLHDHKAFDQLQQEALDATEQQQALLLSQLEDTRGDLAAALARIEELENPTPPPPPDPDPTPDPTPTPTPAGTVSVGFSTKEAWWDSEMAKLKPLDQNITSRRIFADLTSTGRDQETLIRKAVANGQMPCVSYKVPSVNNAIGGSYDDWARAARSFLSSLGVETRFVVWHEPNGDMTPDQFVRLNLRLGPLVKSPKVRWGTYINGFLAISQPTTFNAFLADPLVAQLDWVGIDAYHEGTMENPSTTKTPGSRIRAFMKSMSDRHIDLPLGIGEFNALSSTAMDDVCNLILAQAALFDHACMWSSQKVGETDFRLSGARLEEFKQMLADPRTQR